MTKVVPFGRMLRKVRSERGETQQVLAHAIGVSKAFLSLVERGEKRISVELYNKLDEYLRLAGEEARKFHDSAKASRSSPTSDEDERWHAGLTLMQRRFCEHYASNGGNKTRAASEAGYAQPIQGYSILKKRHVRQALDKLRESTDSELIATREERQAFWTSTMRNEDSDLSSRLRASELMGKSQADFIDRHEVTGANGGPIVFSSREEEDARLAELLKSAGFIVSID